jgi:hypothetical protein
MHGNRSVVAREAGTCQRGHPWTEENAYRWATGGRTVRTCRVCYNQARQRMRQTRRQQRAEVPPEVLAERRRKIKIKAAVASWPHICPGDNCNMCRWLTRWI